MAWSRESPQLFPQIKRGHWSHHGLFGPWEGDSGLAPPCNPCFVRIQMLTGGGPKNVFTEEAVPGGGRKGKSGSAWVERRGLVKRQVAGADTVLAIDKKEEGDEGQTTECVVMWVHRLKRGKEMKLTEYEDCLLAENKERKETGNATQRRG